MDGVSAVKSTFRNSIFAKVNLKAELYNIVAITISIN